MFPTSPSMLPQPGAICIGVPARERAASAALWAIEDDAAVGLSASTCPAAVLTEASALEPRVDAKRARLHWIQMARVLASSASVTAAPMQAVYELRAQLGLHQRDAQRDMF
jgi:hypothetical protein